MSNINQVPFLRVQRLFPQEAQPLSVEMDRAYTDISNSVNSRTIGIHSSNNPTQNGETWYLNGQRYQGFRQIYAFTSTAAINHNINLSNVFAFTQNYGDFTDGTNWYGLLFGSSTAISGQIGFYLSPTQIVFVTGAGAPTLNKGLITLEWLSNA